MRTWERSRLRSPENKTLKQLRSIDKQQDRDRYQMERIFYDVKQLAFSLGLFNFAASSSE